MGRLMEFVEDAWNVFLGMSIVWLPILAIMMCGVIEKFFL